MENNPKENVNQFKKEFKHFVKNTMDNLKKDNTKTENKKEEKHETNVVSEGIDITKIIVGGFIIVIGIIFLLVNFNVIEMDINVFLRSL